MIFSQKIKQYVFVSMVLIAGIQASAQTLAQTLDCSQKAGSVPNVNVMPGTNNPSIPIEHTIVIMQENHSFDNYFGRLNQPKFYGNEVDGITPDMANPDASGKMIAVHREQLLCAQNPKHTWGAMHSDWDNGKNDKFVINSGADAIGFYDDKELGYYYQLANRFAIGDRYFSSAMTQTFPNRFFMLTGTAFGHIKNDIPVSKLGYRQKTIFQNLSEHGVSWKYYKNGPGYLYLFTDFWLKNKHHVGKVSEFDEDLKAGTLPQVVFIDSDMDGEDEHPSDDIQLGEVFVSNRVSELVRSTSWKNSVIFLEYDEAGGFFDHVSPPPACVPDGIEPKFGKEDTIKGHYDRLGFRVPFVAISPFAKTHYVSHVTHEHTSILKFIETKYNLPALTARDANADDLMDIFDFQHPNYDVYLPTPTVVHTTCKKEKHFLGY